MKHILLFGVLGSKKVCFYFSLPFPFLEFWTENINISKILAFPYVQAVIYLEWNVFIEKSGNFFSWGSCLFKKTNLHRIALIVLIMEYETCNLPTEKFIWRKRVFKFLKVEHFCCMVFFLTYILIYNFCRSCIMVSYVCEFYF